MRALLVLFLVMATVALLPLADAARAASTATGPDVAPVDPANGFPRWYQDAGGTRVAPCLDPADPYCVVVADATYDPARPQVFPTNFPSEFFYASADSEPVSTPGCAGTQPGSVSLRLGLQGGFPTKAGPAPGEQMTFGRVRLLVSGGLCPDATYTVTYPLGQMTVQTDSAGALAKGKTTSDVGCTPVAPALCDFRIALSSPVMTRFLRWDPAVAPAAPVGYLGDPATPHRITGASFVAPGEADPANFVRVSGPGLSTPLQTDLFTVAGKVAGPLSADTSALDFGGQVAGTTSGERRVVLTNLAEQPVTPQTVTVGGAAASAFAVSSDGCAGTTLPRDASCTVGLRFSPAAKGVASATLVVAHDGVRSPFALPLAGTGTAPTDVASASVTPSKVDFGTARVATQTATQMLTVANTGTAPLEVSASVLAGLAPGEFAVTVDGCTQRPVAPGASCPVGVAFRPTVAGSPSAHLRLTSNDPLSPALVDLTGRAFGGVATVSPTTSSFDGFPDWYQDEKGVRVTQCIDPDDPYCTVLPGGTFTGRTPLSFTDNFPNEFFYSVADSDKLTTPGCNGTAPGQVRLRMAIEGSFPGSMPAPGEQSTFGRVRITGTGGLCPNTTYRFVHPYGTDLLTTDATGAVRDTQDIGCLLASPSAPCDFGLAVHSPVLGGLLRWDPSTGAVAPAGYLGDGTSLHRVVGAPYTVPGEAAPANSFRVYQGDTLVAQTNLFTVMGKLAGPLVAVPPARTFGSVAEGQSETQAVTLRNDGIDRLTVNGLTVAGAQAGDFTLDAGTDHCTGATLAPGASCAADVTFSPLGVGDRDAQVVVRHTGLDDPLTVSLHGVGLAGGGVAALAVDRASVSFEQLHVDRASVGQTVTVSNTGGTAPLTVGAVSISGADAADFRVRASSCTAAVPVGGTCAITVGVTPSAAGPRSASLQVTAANARPSSLSVALAATGFAGLSQVSPTVRVADGFPDWYQDTNGVRLVPCADGNDPRCVLPKGPGFDPTLPIAFPGNYPAEVFYALADSQVLTTPGCGGSPAGKAMLRLALEGSFAGGSAQPGQQTTFGRIRFDATSGLCPGSTYTVTTPYGELTATADANGAISRTAGTTDLGCPAVPCGFGDALASQVTDGFLRWAPGVGADAPAGYLGDGVSYHRVVGGTYAPAGEPVNYFEIRDPDGTSVVRTDRFLVAGKLASGVVGSATSFGDQGLGSTSIRDVTFTNIGASAVTVGSSALVGADASAFSDTGAGTCPGTQLPPDRSCTVRVAFQPTQERGYAATLRLLGPGGAVLGSGSLTGNGRSSGLPRAAVTPTTLAFGSQRIGTASAGRAVTVSNSGQGTLEVRPPTFTGPAAAEYAATTGSGCAAVPAGGQCTVTVVFTPRSSGDRGATMTVPSNGSGAAPTVALSGTGTSAVITLGQTALDLGTVRVGRTTTKNVSLQNSGTAPLDVTAVSVDDATDFAVDLGTCSRPVAPRRSCSIAVTFRALAPARRSSSVVRFTSDAANGPTLAVSGTSR